MSLFWPAWFCFSVITLSLGSVLATNTSCPTWFYYDNSTQQWQCGVWLYCSSNKTVEIKKCGIHQGFSLYCFHLNMKHVFSPSKHTHCKNQRVVITTVWLHQFPLWDPCCSNINIHGNQSSSLSRGVRAFTISSQLSLAFQK